jgi:hypothetical protein
MVVSYVNPLVAVTLGVPILGEAGARERPPPCS